MRWRALFEPAPPWLVRLDTVLDRVALGMATVVGLLFLGSGLVLGAWGAALLGFAVVVTAVAVVRWTILPIPTTQTHTPEQVRRSYRVQSRWALGCIALLLAGFVAIMLQ